MGRRHGGQAAGHAQTQAVPRLCSDPRAGQPAVPLQAVPVQGGRAQALFDVVTGQQQDGAWEQHLVVEAARQPPPGQQGRPQGPPGSQEREEQPLPERDSC